MPDKALTLVDERGEPVPAGEVGELVVTSRYLADGYWQRPRETAAVFTVGVHDPKERSYRTGDLGHFADDGSFVFLGRRDHQVKIRGYRVDTRDVESALLRLDDVAEAAVIAVREHDEQQLVAFVVLKPGRRSDAAAIRGGLRAYVPAWTLPARVLVIESLPATWTGKIDRQWLGDEARRVAQAGQTGDVPPGVPASPDAAERGVAAVFAHVLRLPTVGRDDDFFDLGGNSLLLAELQLALEAEFKREVTVRDMLQSPTVAGLSALVRLGRTPVHDPSRADEVVVPFRVSGDRSPLFLVHGGFGRALTGRLFLDALGPDRPVYGFQARGLDGRDVPHTRIADMAADYVARLRAVQPVGPYYIGGACAGGLVAIEMACQLRAAGQRTAPVLLVDPASPRGEQGRAVFFAKLTGLRVSARLARYALGRRFLERAVLRRRLRSDGQMHVWVQFRLAAYQHEPSVFDGPVFAIGCEARIADFRAGRWHRCLTGPVEMYEVEKQHLEVMNPSNRRALARLRQYADRLEAWAAAGEASQAAMPAAAGGV